MDFKYDSLKELFETGRDSDLKIICPGKEFNVHQAVVCPRSRVLERMIMTEGKQWDAVIEIYLHDEEVFIVQKLLQFLYTMDYSDEVQGDSDYVSVSRAPSVRSLSTIESESSSEKLAPNNSTCTTPPPTLSPSTPTSVQSVSTGSSEVMVEALTAEDSTSTIPPPSLPAPTAPSVQSVSTGSSEVIVDELTPTPTSVQSVSAGSSQVIPDELTPEHSTSTTQPRIPPSPQSITAHFKLYILASTLTIPALADLSKERYLTLIKTHWNHPSFFKSLHELYLHQTTTNEKSTTNTTNEKSAPNTKIKTLTLATITFHLPTLLTNPSFTTLLHQNSQLTLDILHHTSNTSTKPPHSYTFFETDNYNQPEPFENELSLSFGGRLMLRPVIMEFVQIVGMFFGFFLAAIVVLNWPEKSGPVPGQGAGKVDVTKPMMICQWEYPGPGEGGPIVKPMAW